MNAGRVVTVNGRAIADGTLAVDAGSSFFTSGKSLFETILVRVDTDRHKMKSGAALHLEAHVARMQQAVRRLGWSGLPEGGTLREWLMAAVRRFVASRAADGPYARARLTALWARGDDDAPDVVVTVVPYDRPTTPVTVGVTSVSIPRLPGGIGGVKSGNRIVYEQAQREALTVGADEALLRDDTGAVVEGAVSNLFVAASSPKGYILTTPSLDAGVLPGIARYRVMAIATDMGFSVKEQTLPHDQLLEAMERGNVFLTNALWGVRPVHRWMEGAIDIRARQPSSVVTDLRLTYNADDKLL